VPFHKKKEWSGPKEWRPARPEKWLDSPLLSPDENKKVSLLFAESKREGGLITHAEIAWLCETIKKIGHCGPDDYQFPARLALVNPIMFRAYAARHQSTRLIEFSYPFRGPFLGATLLSHLTTCGPTDAVAVIRPYIRINSGDPASILCLRKSTVVMEVDGDKVLRTPIDEHLILEDGSFPRKNRWKYHPSPNHVVFFACPLDAANNAHTTLGEGIMCPNGSMISVRLLRDEQFDGEVILTTGLVAALYSAKGELVNLGTAP
jgi:hypothetical protein